MADSEKYGYEKLEIYKAAHALANRVHAMSLRLPGFEDREEGSQIRRSSKSVSSQIVEGYALRKYRDDFLRYLHRALGSSDETHEHLRFLHENRSMKDGAEYTFLSVGYRKLSASIGRFIVGVERDHSKPFYLLATAPRLPSMTNAIGQPPSKPTPPPPTTGLPVTVKRPAKSPSENRESRIQNRSIPFGSA